MSKPWVETKGPNETKRYGVDWASVLDGENIATSTWSVTAGGVTLSGAQYDTNQANVLISGGTVGRTTTVLNQITTNSTPPQVLEVTCVLTIAAA